MKKGLKGMIIALGVFGVVIVAVLVYYFGAFYIKFGNVSEKNFLIPGLSEAFVPQGLDYIEEENLYLVSGYMSDGTPSRIYLVDAEKKETIKYITLKTTTGEDYLGHAGGITHTGDGFWVVGDKLLNFTALDKVLNAPNASSVQIQGTKETGNGCDFVSVIGNQLIVGEFHKKGKYDTPKNHEVKVSDTETNYALCYLYDIDLEGKMGINTTVKAALSVPSLVQGLCLNKNGEIVLSTSFSTPSSEILVYKNVFNESVSKYVQINGKAVPAYVLSSNNKLLTLSAPSMSEELVLVDGKVQLLFESACKKYKLINRTRTKYVYSLDI